MSYFRLSSYFIIVINRHMIYYVNTMHKQNTTSTGFTLVELLIVIVVIAILAAISVVAYTNIQNRAYDSIIQSDLSNFAKKIELAAAETGEYPAGGGTNVSEGVRSASGQQNFPGFKFNPTKSAYDTVGQNLFYCTDTETFQLRAKSKSGNVFVYNSSGGIKNIGAGTINIALACEALTYPRTFSYGYYNVSDTWWSWTN